jgi:hypothetical protein
VSAIISKQEESSGTKVRADPTDNCLHLGRVNGGQDKDEDDDVER